MTNREQFEAWFKSPVNDDIRAKLIVEFAESVAWQAWQASREAIEIVMPPSVITTEIGPAISHEKMIARLAVNGIKVKS